MIPLARPWYDEHETSAVSSVLESGMLVQGERVAAFEAQLCKLTTRDHAIALSSGTSALVLALQAVDIKAGDEVLCPALTWPSPAHAIMLVGATPVFVDVDLKEWNSTAEDYQRARTSKTRAAIVIDQFGNPARHHEISNALPNITLIEDAACALGSSIDAKPCASYGSISCLSFHPRKIITTGEGGACLTDDSELAKRLRTLRNHGIDAEQGFVEAAGNFRMTEIAAALGICQIEKLPAMVDKRRALASRYREALPELSFQEEPSAGVSNFQTLGVIPPSLRTKEEREKLMHALLERDVQSGILSYAIHQIASTPNQAHALPHAEELANRGLALPMYPTMTPSEQDRVIEAMHEVLS